MKKIGEYTCRGSVNTDNQLNKIILDDGRFDTGYRVTEFKVWIHDVDTTTIRLMTAKLMTDDDAQAGINFNADNNEEIAWAMFNFDGNDPRVPHYWSLVDPDNLVVQDLFIIADESVASADIKVNYFIRMEKYEFNDSTGALAMVRNRSQA